MVSMNTGAGGGQAARSMGSGWPTPGPGSPAFRKGMARQAGCAGVVMDDEHGRPSVAKLGGRFPRDRQPAWPHVIDAWFANARASRPRCQPKQRLACLARADRGCSHT